MFIAEDGTRATLREEFRALRQEGHALRQEGHALRQETRMLNVRSIV